MKRGIAGKGFGNKGIYVLTAVLACAWINGAAARDVYTWTDEDGTVHFSDVPVDPADNRTIAVDGAEDPVTAGVASANVEGETSAAEQIRAQIAENRNALKKEQAEVDRLCEKHRARLEEMEPARRIYVKDDSGEMVRMDDNQRMGLIDESKEFIAKYCG